MIVIIGLRVAPFLDATVKVDIQMIKSPAVSPAGIGRPDIFHTFIDRFLSCVDWFMRSVFILKNDMTILKR